VAATDHPPLDAAEAAAWSTFERAQERLRSVMARELTQETGLSDADFQILSVLASAYRGRLRAFDLRCELQWEKSRLSHQLRRMEQRGLIRREACADDGRASDVVLTDAGREAGVRGKCARAGSIRRHVLGPLGKERLAALADLAMDLDMGLRDTLPRHPPDED
jgi:DNA-binding MarR family transcriptional regulator